jgi:DNA helicase-2/ATP-dependent DNA helicase PcrA
MFAADWDEGLDEAQLAAVVHGDGPLVVLAGAGTGKTRMLTARVARLLERGTPPERVLLLTFTRRAADEMLARAAVLAGRGELAGRLQGGTFHASAYRLLRAFGEALGVSPSFSLLDPADAADLMALLRDEHGLGTTSTRKPSATTLVEVYSRCVNLSLSVGEVVEADFPWCEADAAAIAEVCRHYVATKRARGLLDFDDLLLYWRAALLDEHLGPRLVGMFDYVLVDECQDVNDLQADIVRRLRPDGRGLTLVGDDAQAIYAFRGASAAHLAALARSFLGTTVVRLERSFRSLQPILDLANHLRPLSAEAELGETKPLELVAARVGGRRPTFVRCYDASFEARALVERILERREQGRRLRDQAVLVRAAHHSDLIELELAARKVPYRKYGGLRFTEAAHVKDLAAAIRLLDNPADEIAWFRLLKLHEGIGPAAARRLVETLWARQAEPAQDWLETVAAAPAIARVALAGTLEALDAARAAATTFERVERTLGLLRPLVRARYDDAEVRLGDLDRLAATAVATDDLASWLVEVTLDPPLSTSSVAGPPRLDEDYVVVSTIHSAKGLEWPVVHLPHLVDGAFPSDLALRSSDGLAEEARLFYVAVTRARDELILYAPARMPHRRRSSDDRHSLAPQSRFLDEAALGLVSVEEVLPSRPLPNTGLEPGALGPRALGTLGLDRLWR